MTADCEYIGASVFVECTYITYITVFVFFNCDSSNVIWYLAEVQTIVMYLCRDVRQVAEKLGFSYPVC